MTAASAAYGRWKVFTTNAAIWARVTAAGGGYFSIIHR